ncbi:MAG: arginine deiminase family protein [Terriglobales bacterium]
MQTLAKPATFTANSMVAPLRRVLVCSPHSAGWDTPGQSSEWQKLGFLRRPDFGLAQAQHHELCRQLQEVAEVVQLPPASDLSLDAVYAHDPSLPTDYGVIVMNPGKPNRRPEARRQAEHYKKLGVKVLGEVRDLGPGKAGTSEAGDIVWLDSHTLLIGSGYRTNPPGIEQMCSLLVPKGIEVNVAPLPYGPGPSACLHLMSLISLLDERTALVDLPWLAVETVELLKAQGYKFIEIDASERDTLACNVLSLGNNRLLALEENPKTNAKMHAAGFDVRTFPGSELCINGNGGPTCLTRPLARG